MFIHLGRPVLVELLHLIQSSLVGSRLVFSLLCGEDEDEDDQNKQRPLGTLLLFLFFLSLKGDVQKAVACVSCVSVQPVEAHPAEAALTFHP